MGKEKAKIRAANAAAAAIIRRGGYPKVDSYFKPGEDPRATVRNLPPDAGKKTFYCAKCPMICGSESALIGHVRSHLDYANMADYVRKPGTAREMSPRRAAAVQQRFDSYNEELKQRQFDRPVPITEVADEAQQLQSVSSSLKKKKKDTRQRDNRQKEQKGEKQTSGTGSRFDILAKRQIIRKYDMLKANVRATCHWVRINFPDHPNYDKHSLKYIIKRRDVYLADNIKGRLSEVKMIVSKRKAAYPLMEDLLAKEIEKVSNCHILN